MVELFGIKKERHKEEQMCLYLEGIVQANRVKDYIETLNIEEIYTSPLKRAFETAQIISQNINNSSIIIEEGLTERSFGHYEGYLIDDLPYSILTKDNPEFDGEDNEESSKRLKECLLRIVNNTEKERILIVTHGGILYNFLKEYAQFNSSESELSNRQLGNCSITTLTYDGDFHIKEIGYLGYLQD